MLKLQKIDTNLSRLDRPDQVVTALINRDSSQEDATHAYETHVQIIDTEPDLPADRSFPVSRTASRLSRSSVKEGKQSSQDYSEKDLMSAMKPLGNDEVQTHRVGEIY